MKLADITAKLTYRHTKITCYMGYISQAIAVNIAPLFFVVFKDDYGISMEKLGRLTFILFITQLAVDLLTLKYADKIGYRRVIVAGHLFAFLGLISLAVLPQLLPYSYKYIGLCISVSTYAIGSGIIDVLVSPLIDAIPDDAKASNMSLLHSFYCWGQLLTVAVTTIILKFIGTKYWYLIPALWSLVPIFTMVRFLYTPIAPPIPDSSKMSVKQLLKNRLFIIALILILCSGASELSMSQWSSLFAERGLGITKMTGDLLGPGLFAVMMGVGRIIFSIFGKKINLAAAITGCAVFCVACYLLAALSPSPVLAMVGCALCGLAVSIMWPGVLSLSSARFPGGGTALFGLCATFGDLGCSVGPWLTGIISDLAPAAWGLKAGLFAGILFPCVMFVCLLYFIRRTRGREDAGDGDARMRSL
jgi:MFS family permease